MTGVDQIERELTHLAATLQAAWQKSQCLTCPLGELAALAAATLAFYQEQQKNLHDHWTNYRKP